MYFVQSGIVGIAINAYSRKMSRSFYKIGFKQKGRQLICDYYVVHRKKSNFIYLAVEEINAYAM
jgi:hypothetical protein